MYLKRLFTTTLAILATSPLLADNCNSCDPCDPVEVCNDCTPAFLCGCICDWCDWENGWSVQADWIYWKVRRCDLDYAIKGPANVDATLEGKYHCVDPSRDGGFRVAVFKDCGDCWRFGMRYTRFETDAYDSVSSPVEDTNFVATRAFILTNAAPLVNAVSTYKFDLGAVDLESSYLFRFDCSDVTLRSFTGVRIAFIDQDIKTKYEYREAIDNDDADTTVDEMMTMDAYGLMFGLESEWDDLWCGVGLYGKIASILSVTKFEASHLETNVGTEDTFSSQVNVKKRQYLVVPSWEIAVGLEYKLCPWICADWDVKLGYEFHSWCNLPDYINAPSSEVKGMLTRAKTDLSYEGLFLRLTGTF